MRQIAGMLLDSLSRTCIHLERTMGEIGRYVGTNRREKKPWELKVSAQCNMKRKLTVLGIGHCSLSARSSEWSKAPAEGLQRAGSHLENLQDLLTKGEQL